MPITLPYPSRPSNNDDVVSLVLRDNFAAIAQWSGAIPGTDISTGTIPVDRMVAAGNVETRDSEQISNFVASGLNPGGFSVFGFTFPSGVIYISGKRISVAGQSYTVSASQDTYYDVNSVGTISAQAVSNNATAPSLAANSIRLAKVISNATTITSIVQNGVGPYNVLIYPRNPNITMLYKPAMKQFVQTQVSPGNTWNIMLTTGASVMMFNTGFEKNGHGWKVLYKGVYRLTIHGCFVDVAAAAQVLVGYSINLTTGPNTGAWSREYYDGNPHSIELNTLVSCNAGDTIYGFSYAARPENYRLGSNDTTAAGDNTYVDLELVSLT